MKQNNVTMTKRVDDNNLKHIKSFDRDTYRFLDRPSFGLNWSTTCALEVSVQLWGNFVQLWVSHLVDWFATCT